MLAVFFALLALFGLAACGLYKLCSYGYGKVRPMIHADLVAWMEGE